MFTSFHGLKRTFESFFTKSVKSTMNAIEINNLEKIYKKRIRAIDDFSLTIPAAVVFGIVGPNGAGKSTIMNILAGVVNQTAGDFSILSQQIKKGETDYKRKVGFVLEKPHYI